MCQANPPTAWFDNPQDAEGSEFDTHRDMGLDTAFDDVFGFEKTVAQDAQFLHSALPAPQEDSFPAWRIERVDGGWTQLT